MRKFWGIELFSEHLDQKLLKMYLLVVLNNSEVIMDSVTRRRYTRVYRSFFGLSALFGYAVILTVTVDYTTTMRVRELGPVLLPVLAVFVGFSALLYNRARAYPDGPIQRRSLYAADEVMKSTVLYLFGLMLGGLITFWVYGTDFKVGSKMVIGDPEQTKLLYLYAIPLFFVCISFFSFAHALRIFCKKFTIRPYLRQKFRSMKKKEKKSSL
jgi:hypothetical protein